MGPSPGQLDPTHISFTAANPRKFWAFRSLIWSRHCRSYTQEGGQVLNMIFFTKGLSRFRMIGIVLHKIKSELQVATKFCKKLSAKKASSMGAATACPVNKYLALSFCEIYEHLQFLTRIYIFQHFLCVLIILRFHRETLLRFCDASSRAHRNGYASLFTS